MTTMVATSFSCRLRGGGANSADELAPEIRKSTCFSWGFVTDGISFFGSIFWWTDRCRCPFGRLATTTASYVLQSSFIVFVIFVLNAPYVLLGIASQGNLRYNVPNR